MLRISPVRRRATGSYSWQRMPSKAVPRGRPPTRVGGVLPLLVHEPLSAVVVVEERGVEAGGVHVDGVRPGAGDGGGGDEVVVGVLEVAVVALDVGVDQPEEAVGVAEAGGPDAAAVGLAAQVELARAVERAGDEAPVHQVAGVVDLDARIPFEGGGGDPVIVFGAADGRVGIEALEDRVLDHGVSPPCRRALAGLSGSGRPDRVASRPRGVTWFG